MDLVQATNAAMSSHRRRLMRPVTELRVVSNRQNMRGTCDLSDRNP